MKPGRCGDGDSEENGGKDDLLSRRGDAERIQSGVEQTEDQSTESNSYRASPTAGKRNATDDDGGYRGHQDISQA